MTMKKMILTLLAGSVLTGCSVTGLENASSNFACGYDGDPRCQPLSDVHEDVAKTHDGKNGQEVFITVDGDPITRLTYEQPLSMPRRAPEMILRIWIAPFIDEDGDLHDQHTMYSTVRTARWAPETLAVHKTNDPRVLTPLDKKPEPRREKPSILRQYIEGAMSK